MKSVFLKVFVWAWVGLVWFGFVGPAAVSAESTFLVGAWVFITSAVGMWAVYRIVRFVVNVNKGEKK